jgi:hypothetical protein
MLAAQERDNVVEFPRPPAKAVPPDRAGQFVFSVWTATDVIGGNALNTLYADELVLVDPDAPLEDNCLVVMLLKGGRPHMTVW